LKTAGDAQGDVPGFSATGKKIKMPGATVNSGESRLKDGIEGAANGFEENLCAPASLREKNKFQPVVSLNADKPRE